MHFLIFLRIIALQNFVVFCHKSTRISHRHTHVPSLLNLPPISLPIPPHQIVTEPLFEFPDSPSKFLLAFYFTYGIVNFHVTLSIHLTISFPIPPFQIVTEPLFEFPESYSKFLLAIYFICISVYVFILLSPFVPPSPSHFPPHPTPLDCHRAPV